ncbi:DUF6492 family protein [Nonomuraea rubra]|uniref:Uncharacterized protein n=1 Tax=Nonomuraea rubra TaxID=46180 RepID=A0A7X0P6U1_9ACTN|nr:DUF6492 family protein [Nonomuraea rubra]MBB6556355.1 hypothetical protein [Nonomuraea rubra]
MSKLAVITPSYAPDAELFADLHRSVLEFTSDDTIHHVFVPPGDREAFARFEGPRCHVWVRSELLPRRYLRMPGTDVYVNYRRPWPPLRGWVMQQTVKIASVGLIDADAMLIVDSDAVLVRPTSAESFSRDGRLCLYRLENGVTAEMKRHVIWHQVARDLLGLPPAPPAPLPDYVTALTFWDPEIVRAMQRRITQVTGRDWLDAFNAQLHVSEFILYGVFVDEVLKADPPINTTICHLSYNHEPWDEARAVAFADQLPQDAVGMMISAKSHTPMEARQAAIRRCAQVVESS